MEPATVSHRSVGHLLIQRGFATEEQIARCVDIQSERARRGDFVRLGALLVEQGIVSPNQIAEVLQEQRIAILICSVCAGQYNIHNYSEDAVYECRQCHGRLRRPKSLDSVTIQDSVRSRPRDMGAKETVRVSHQNANDTDRFAITGATRFGNYEILGEIARGGMGVIYKAREIPLDRPVALKTLRAEEARHGDAVERFIREARAVASLRHPNLVAVHSVDRLGDIHFFTMEFVEGLALDRQLQNSGPLEPRKALSIILPIAEALEYAHSQNVFHRDLKPSNIIVDSYQQPFLVDFGIAKRKGDRQLTEEGEILGSVPYMAPEYVLGEKYSEACDVYSLGVVLYEALAGYENLPFTPGETHEEVKTLRLLNRIAYEAPAPIRKHVPGIDKKLEGIINKAIARPLSKRYESVKDLVVDLRSWVEEHEALAQESSAAQVAARAAPRSRTGLLVLLLLLLLLSLAGNGVLVTRLRQRPSLDRSRQLCTQLLDAAEQLERQQQAASARKLKALARELIEEQPGLADLAARLESPPK